MEQKTIITIECQYGSGGENIGKLLAQKLGIAFFDKEILVEASKESGIEESVFYTFDENFVNAGGSSLISDVRAARTSMREYEQPLVEQVYLAEFNVIKKLAREQSGVFIGRCSDYVLQEDVDVVRFFIYAPIDVRVERVCRYENLNCSDAEIVVRKRDKERERYYHYYTSRKMGDVCNYNLSVDTGSIGADEAAALLEQYVKSAGKPIKG